MWHVIKYRLDWIGKTWTRLIKHGLIKNGGKTTWINKTCSDETWIRNTLLWERTLRRRGCGLIENAEE